MGFRSLKAARRGIAALEHKARKKKQVQYTPTHTNDAQHETLSSLSVVEVDIVTAPPPFPPPPAAAADALLARFEAPPEGGSKEVDEERV